ncbi:MAG: hypothetical protein EP340_03985 [Alphaproteobacteria bacterium]|nr:MAG: hypothetical protein EP340_03985 [Alphaproteobacteria bacterium]
MKKFLIAGIASMMIAGSASAESFEEMCLRVSDEWQSTGDVASQCSCLAEKAAADQSLADEITSLTETASNDSEAYEAGSDSVKAAFDECSVES